MKTTPRCTAAGRFAHAFVFALVVIVSSAITGCGGFDPDAPWTLSSSEEEGTPIPEGTPIIEHDPVPIEARTERIDLVEDLVIREGREPLYRPIDVDADASGNIYVFDAGNNNIVAFDRRGDYLRTIGREGQGPGEIGQGGRIAAAGGHIVHVGYNRMNIWSADGEVLGLLNLTFTNFLLPIRGIDDGRIVGLAQRRSRNEGTRQVVVRLDLEGSPEQDYIVLPTHDPLSVTQGSRSRNTGIPVPRPAFAVARTGEVYATAGADYDVVAFAADGTSRWALRVPWPRRSLTDERIDQAMRHLMGLDDGDNDIPGFDSVRRSEVSWPDLLPALAGEWIGQVTTTALVADGHGHLYVFPFIPHAWDRSDQPVDVYSADGEHLFSGMVPMVRWDAVRGDFVYGIDTDSVTEEYRAVRYRLVEPF